MPTLDSCINDLFEPGNIPSDPGTWSAGPPYGGYELTQTGERIAIISTTPPPGSNIVNRAFIEISFYRIGDVILSGNQ